LAATPDTALCSAFVTDRDVTSRLVGARGFLRPTASGGLWGPPSSGLFPWGVNLTTHVHLILRLRMCGVNLHSPYVFTACSPLFTCYKQHVKYPRFLIIKPSVISLSVSRVWGDQSCSTAGVTSTSQVAVNLVAFVRPVTECDSTRNGTRLYIALAFTALYLHIAQIRSNSASPLANYASHQCENTFAVLPCVRHVFTSAATSSCSFALAGFHATKS
jgi:hypothetical protein